VQPTTDSTSDKVPHVAASTMELLGKRVRTIQPIRTNNLEKPKILEGKVIGVTSRPYGMADGEYVYVKNEVHCSDRYSDRVIPVLVSNVEVVE
jgi:hypothetical protein